MSLSAAVLDALIAHGASAEMIVAAVKADNAIDDARKARQREGNAVRQRRYREAHNADNALPAVTGVTNSDKTSPLTPPLKASPDPLKITPPISPQPVVVSERAGNSFPPPEGVEAGQWIAFRKQRKKSINDRSYLMICNKLKTLAEAGWPPGEMIDLATERGWETVFEPKEPKNGRQQPANGLRGTRPDPSLDMLKQARADLAAERSYPEPGGGTRLALPSFGPS